MPICNMTSVLIAILCSSIPHIGQVVQWEHYGRSINNSYAHSVLINCVSVCSPKRRVLVESQDMLDRLSAGY